MRPKVLGRILYGYALVVLMYVMLSPGENSYIGGFAGAFLALGSILQGE